MSDDGATAADVHKALIEGKLRLSKFLPGERLGLV
jgi:hypothetical protein